MTAADFAPKGEEQLKTEILEDLGCEYEGNEDVVDKMVARGLKDEELKASLHTQKKNAQDREAKKVEALKKAGLDPETGEKLVKEPVAGEQTPNNDNLSPKDYLALTENKVSSEDFDEVMRLSKVLGKTVAETLKDKTAKMILDGRVEERKTAEAVNTGLTRKSNSSKGSILKKALEGNLADDEIAEGAKSVVADMFKQG